MAHGLYREWLTPDGLMLLRDWRRKGITIESIARDHIGIGVSTIYTWMKEHKDIRDALTRGRELANAEMGNAMFNAGIGYTVTLKRPQKVKHVEYDPVTGKKVREWEEVVEAEYQEHVPANFNAQKCYLYNRDSENWHEQREVRDVEDDNTGVLILPARTEGAEDG